MQKIEITSLPELDYHGKEAYKTLRSNLQFTGENVKTVAITSCTPGDGKSSVSLRLAVSLTEIGKKVLFIDADLRRSVIMGRHHIVAKKNRGLTHYLSGQNALAEVLCATNVDGLTMILTGPVPPNPSELLSGRLFQEMLTSSRDEYDYIIIDTPPLGSVIDSAIVSRECDGVAIVVSADTVSYKFVQKVKNQLETSGCKVLGVILNKVKLGGSGYYGKYYGRYYGKYYGKYYGEYGNEEKGKKSK